MSDRMMPVCIFNSDALWERVKKHFGLESARLDANRLAREKAAKFRAKGWKTFEVVMDEECVDHLLKGTLV